MEQIKEIFAREALEEERLLKVENIHTEVSSSANDLHDAVSKFKTPIKSELSALMQQYRAVNTFETSDWEGESDKHSAVTQLLTMIKSLVPEEAVDTQRLIVRCQKAMDVLLNFQRERAKDATPTINQGARLALSPA